MTLRIPRLSATDPALASLLTDAQTQLDESLKKKTKGALECSRECGVKIACLVTRNDGEFLSLACTQEFWKDSERPSIWSDSLLFRRRGKRFAPLALQSLARKPEANLLLRLRLNDDSPLDPSEEPPSLYAALGEKNFEIGPAIPFTSEEITYPPFVDAAPHLSCDTLLDFPAGAPMTPSGETGALAVASDVIEADNPKEALPWAGSGAKFTLVHFAAIEARHTAAAKMLNEAIDDFIHKTLQRAKVEEWLPELSCNVYTNTNKLVSVLCHGQGSTKDGDTRTVRSSITLRLSDPPERVDVSEIFAKNPGAPREIARRCLGHLVRKPKDKYDETLKALPALKTSDLSSFALWQSGVSFAIEYELAGKHRKTTCYVPNDVLGVSAEALATPKKP